MPGCPCLLKEVCVFVCGGGDGRGVGAPKKEKAALGGVCVWW